MLGGSYGGYMVLASLTNFPDRIKAGIDIVGIASFVTFLKNTSGYRQDLRRAEYGDERDPAMHAYFEAIAPLNHAAKIKTPLLVAVDGHVAGLIGARDTVRPEAHDVVHDLKHVGISEVALLTGDRPTAARSVARKTHIKTVESELLPADKARWVEERQAAGRRVAMVGDGINDAPALARAHVGIALGGIGADLAAEAGDVVVLGEPLLVLPGLVKLSRATVAVIRQNIIGFAIGLNAVAMASAAFGLLGPVAAAILHQASASQSTTAHGPHTRKTCHSTAGSLRSSLIATAARQTSSSFPMWSAKRKKAGYCHLSGFPVCGIPA